jgi:hypothetical protein
MLTVLAAVSLVPGCAVLDSLTSASAGDDASVAPADAGLADAADLVVDAEPEPDVIDAQPAPPDADLFPGRVTMTVPGGLDLARCDIDGDGHVDVLVSFDDRHVAGFLASENHDGFGIPVLNGAPFAFQRMLCTDLNDNGMADLVGEDDDKHLYVLLDPQLGQAAPAPQTIDMGTFLFGGEIVAGDLNRDGLVDLTVARTVSTIPVVFQASTGGGIFTGPITQVTSTQSVNSLVIVDVDGDGGNDLVYAAQTSRLFVQLQKPTAGTFNPTQTLFDVVGGQTEHVQVADLDNTGRPEILAGYDLGLHFFHFLGPGGSIADHDLTCTPRAPSDGQMVTGDVDGNALLDVMVSGMPALIYRQDGPLSFASAPLRYPVPFAPRRIASADLDLDGHADLVVLDATAADVHLTHP